MEDIMVLLTIFMLIFFIIWWIIILSGMWMYRKKRKCPRDRICKNTDCKWKAWCKKYDRYSDKIKYYIETMRAMKKQEKAEAKARERQQNGKRK